jgi:hypothetical protein
MAAIQPLGAGGPALRPRWGRIQLRRVHAEDPQQVCVE